MCYPKNQKNTTTSGSTAPTRSLLVLLWAIILFTHGISNGTAQTGTGASDEQLYDVVLLIDGSGSMQRTDPDGLVVAQAMHIVDVLELSDPRNRVAVLFFSDQILKVFPANGLTNDFKAVREKLQALPRPHGGTKMKAPLDEARKRLAQSNRTKAVFLVTDGMAEDAAQVEVQVPLFKDIDAPVSAVGFSPQAHRAFLQMLARGTGGGAAIVETVGDLEEAVDAAIEAPWNVLKVFDVEHQGGTQTFETTFTIPNHIQKSRIRVIYEDKRKPENFEVKFISPSGREVTTAQRGLADVVSFVGGQGGNRYLLFDRLFATGAGGWKVRVASKTMSPLPKLRVVVDGKTDLRLVVQLEPEQERYPYTDPIDIRVGLQSGDSPGAPMTPPDEVEIQAVNGQGEVQPVPYGGDKATYQPPAKAEPQRLKIAALYQGVTLRTSIPITLVHPEPIKLIASPNRLDLGTIGLDAGTDENRKRTTLMLRYESQAGNVRGSIPFAVASMNLYHKQNGDGITSAWFNAAHGEGQPMPLSRFKGRIPKDGAKIHVGIDMPKDIPTGLPDGQYTGEIVISSERSDEELVIPVTLRLHRPDLIVSEHLRFDFSWWFLSKMERTLTVKTTASTPLNIFLTLPKRIDSDTGELATLTAGEADASDPWAVEPATTDTVMNRLGPFEVPPEKSIALPIKLEMLFDEAESVPAGTYEKTVIVEGGGRTKEVPLQLVVPKYYLADVAKKLLMVLAVLLGLAGMRKTFQEAWRQAKFGAGKRVGKSLEDGGELTIGTAKGDTISIPVAQLTPQQARFTRRGDAISVSVGDDATVLGQSSTVVRLKEDDTISLYPGPVDENDTPVITLEATLLPDADSDRIRFKVTDSPFTSPVKTFAKAATAVTLIFISQPLLYSEWMARFFNNLL